MTTLIENSISTRMDKLLQDFAILPEPSDRMAHMIAKGHRWPKMDAIEKTEENQIHGCLSRLWIKTTVKDGRFQFRMDAEASMSKGLAATLCEIYTNATPQEIMDTPVDIITPLGTPLSLGRQIAIKNLQESIRAFAKQQQDNS